MLFDKNYNVYNVVYMLISSELLVPITSRSFIRLHLPVSERAKFIARGCLFFKIYITYYNLLKCMCFCISELHVLRLFIVV